MPLKDETEPIADDEWLYRRVHTTRFRTAKTPFVSPSAFEPNVKGNYPDTDDNIQGHVSVPELSTDAFVKDKTRCKGWMIKLAELVSPDERISVEPDPINPRE